MAELLALEPASTLAGRKRQLNVGLSRVADRLGNTLAICRKSYVHPALAQAFLDNPLTVPSAPKRRGLTDPECDLVSFLEEGAGHRAAA